jgi:hypothetical protein
VICRLVPRKPRPALESRHHLDATIGPCMRPPQLPMLCITDVTRGDAGEWLVWISFSETMLE